MNPRAARVIGAISALAAALGGCSTLLPGQDVRYSPTPHHVVAAMLQLAGVGPDDVVYDLGSGDGRVIVSAARDFGARGIGYDIVPELVAESVRSAETAGVSARARFAHGNIFEVDMSPATVVTLYLSEELNERLRPKLLRELRPGARIVSYRVDMGAWRPDRTISVDVDGRPRSVYLWIVPRR
ncbi:MAG: class I SAM-dependent methyltransferase [Candidatus Rokubacteria bacterium]|nr:class I SAM-dependent methyltransferase [Candidatus Rokubacteria bacterium]